VRYKNKIPIAQTVATGISTINGTLANAQFVNAALPIIKSTLRSANPIRGISFLVLNIPSLILLAL